MRVQQTFFGVALTLATVLSAVQAMAQVTTDVVFTRQAPPSYAAGQMVEITVTIAASNPAAITAMGLYETVPAGWTFVGLRGITSDPPAIAPAPGQDALLEFAWIVPPSFPAIFAYTLQAPADANDVQYITGQVEYRESGQAEKSNVETTELNGPPKPDTQAPVITLIGGTSITLRQGTAWSEPGYTATDDVDGDLTGSVVVSGEPNTSQPGISTITYSVTDKAGRTGRAQRTVRVTGNTVSGGGIGGVDPGDYEPPATDNGAGTDTGTGAVDTPATGTPNTAAPAAGGAMARPPVPANLSNIPPPPVVPPGDRKPLDPARLNNIMKQLSDKEKAAAAGETARAETAAPEAEAATPVETAPVAPENDPGQAAPAPVPEGSVPPPGFGVPATAAPVKRAATMDRGAAVPPPGFFTRVGQKVSTLGTADYGTIVGILVALAVFVGMAAVAWKFAYGGRKRHRGGPGAK